MVDPLFFGLFCLIFAVAGVVKGLVGFGMPTISLGLLTVFVGVEEAIVLILWPTIASNVFQALSGGYLWALLARLWPFLLSAVLTLWFGTLVLRQMPEGGADLVLGLLMVSYAVPLLAGATFQIPSDRERPVGVMLGAINGIFSGLTGLTPFPASCTSNPSA